MTDLSPIDRDAMRRAIEITRQRSPARAQQVDDMLADPTRSWERVGQFCAYSCQMNSLNLQPWETPPCWVRGDIEAALFAPDDGRGVRDATRLLKRMLNLGISRYEPDPLAAIAAAEQRRAAK